MVATTADSKAGLDEETYIEQVGEVEYYYDFNENGIYMRQANYSQAIASMFGSPKKLVSSVAQLKFEYFYITDTAEVFSNEILDVIPSCVHVQVKITDESGERVL